MILAQHSQYQLLFLAVAVGRLLPLANRILIALQSVKFFKPSFNLILNELKKKNSKSNIKENIFKKI